ncbi:MAG: group II intron reverse transcriptase/maturase [Verrucomicrobia bacterium]|nr:group II intron reverse transcriptase/maturase [Verrucomicrobiota bacterium]
MKLVTPSSVQELQKALYERAKRDQELRFYSLYDKVYRQDVLACAYAQNRANKGAAGPDGVTFDDIEESGGPDPMLARLAEELRTKQYTPGPVRRVYIPKANGGERPLGIPDIRDRVVAMAVKLVLEPIFEADFDPDSYGFRPGRSAHQALAAIRESVAGGMEWIVDADVSRCFDAIPHDKLLKTVASRVVDGSMLALVKKLLTAPVLDERDGGRRTRPRAGTPQGGPASPLLANIYLHLLDRNFRSHVESGELHGRLVRYCDDFVIICPHYPRRERVWLERLMTRLGLTLHPEKTRVVHVRKEWVNFLGYRIRRTSSGRVALDISQKAMTRIRDRLRETTRRTYLSQEELISELNVYIRGSSEYFRLAEPRTMWNLDRFVLARIARWARHKRVRRQPVWSLARGGPLYREHGLANWWRKPQSTKAPARARS